MEKYIKSRSKLHFKWWFLNSSLFSKDNVNTGARNSSRVKNFLLPLFCYCFFVIKTEDGWQDCKTSFPRTKFTRQVFCSFLSAPMIPLFHACGHRMRSFWVTGTTRFESVDITCQIWPIRGYTRRWYTGADRLKKWLQAPPPLLSPVSSPFTFVLALSQFSGPNYLEAWNRLAHFKLLNRRLLWDKGACFYCLLYYDLSLQKSTSTLRIVSARRYCFYHES